MDWILANINLAAGLSGAWVIRDGKLCGSVYAAYDKSPYLHMLPAEGTFLDIFSMLPVSAARVATSVDCTAVRVPSSKGYVSDLNSHVLESDSGESARPQPLWAPSRRQPDTCPSCGRTVGNEWEWQPGPNGPNTLCTSCGLGKSRFFCFVLVCIGSQTARRLRWQNGSQACSRDSFCQPLYKN